MRILRAAAITAAVALTAAVFGLAREMVVAATFGAERSTDAFYFANDLTVRFPEFVIPAVTAALIPLYIRASTPEQRERLVNTVVSILGITLIGLTLTTMVTSGTIVRLVGGGFDQPGQALAATTLQILAPAITLLGATGIFKALLEAENRFFVSQISQVIISIGVIAGVLYLADRLGGYSIAVGLTVAAVAQLAWVMFWLHRAGVRYRPAFNLRHPDLTRFFSLLWPGLIGAVILWMTPVIDKALASYLPAGAVSALSFGNRPVAVVERVGIQSLVIVGLPIFSWQAAKRGMKALARSVEDTLGTVVFVLAPATFLLIALRLPVTRLLFERGAFDASATNLTTLVMAAYAVALVPEAMAVTISTVFKSIEDTRTPALWGAGVNLVSKAVFSPLLLIPFGAPGLALSTALMYLVSSIVMIKRLGKAGLDVDVPSLMRRVGRILVLSVAAALPAFFLTRTGLSSAAMLGFALLIAIPVYLVAAHLLKVPELARIRSTFRRRAEEVTSSVEK